MQYTYKAKPGNAADNPTIAYEAGWTLPGPGDEGTWGTIKIARINGAIFTKFWEAGEAEPEQWTNVLYADVLDTSVPGYFRFQPYSQDAVGLVPIDVDNIIITQQTAVDASRTHLGNSLSQQFAVSEELIADGSDAYAVIDKQNADGTVETQTVMQNTWGKDNENGKHVITFSGVDAKEMTDTLTVQLYNAAGQAIGAAYTDSTKDYAMRQIQSTTQDIASGKETEKNTKIRTMLVDMLNYGAAAQNYFDHNTDNLANKELTEAQQSNWATKELADITNTRNCTNTNVYKGTRLNLKSSLGFQMAFDLTGCDLSKVEICYSYTDHYGNRKEGTITNGQMIDGVYVITVDTVVLADARQDVTVTVSSDGNELVSVTDSIAAYVARVQRGEVNAENLEELKELCQMLMKFSDSSHTYLHHNDNGGNN